MGRNKAKPTMVVIPGSFNPLHAGHIDMIYKVCHLADYVCLAVGQNPDKKTGSDLSLINKEFQDGGDWIKVKEFAGSFPLFLETMEQGYDIVAVVRGLRNTNDFINDQALLYNYEDLGLNQLVTPVLFVMADRERVHISSTSERAKAGLERK